MPAVAEHQNGRHRLRKQIERFSIVPIGADRFHYEDRRIDAGTALGQELWFAGLRWSSSKAEYPCHHRRLRAGHLPRDSARSCPTFAASLH